MIIVFGFSPIEFRHAQGRPPISTGFLDPFTNLRVESSIFDVDIRTDFETNMDHG